MEIKFSNVSYNYGNKTVLENINLTINHKKITGIIGSSGSGKTTLVQLINALLIPTTGEIKLGDFVIVKNKKIKDLNNLRKEVGLIFQFPEEQFFNQTVQEEIAFALHNFKFKLDIINKHVIDALNIVGLNEKYLTKNPFKLSNGEKRLVAIASILAYNPNVIIFDEPTIGLDNVSRRNLIKIIRKLKNRLEKTIIIISHDVDFLNEIVDDIVIVNDGKIIISGKKMEVFKNVDALSSIEITIPKVILFQNIVKDKKNIKLSYYDNTNDLIKDIYRNVK